MNRLQIENQNLQEWVMTKVIIQCNGGFHLHHLVFPFVYQFNSRIWVLVHSRDFNNISDEKECSFYTHLFCCTAMRWLFISSTAIWITGSDNSSVASRARIEHVNELEFELCIYNVNDTAQLSFLKGQMYHFNIQGTHKTNKQAKYM